MKFNFKKKYGQNFLQDKKVISDIALSINPNKNDLIIEIGPGSGALTKELVNYECPLLCYEIDTDVKNYLDQINKDNFTIIYDDFLNRDIKNDIINYKYEKLYIVGNLPYYITTPIIMHILESQVEVENMVFMVQKEVADRFSAKPNTKEYGSISVFLNYYYDIEKLFVVNKNKFYPVPNVDSAVIRFIAKSNRLNVDFDKFNRLVKDAFMMKRKNLRNNLRNYNLEKIDLILKEHNLSLANRAEDLSYDIFVDIANKL